MGLDMFLDRETYIGANYEHRNVTGNIFINFDGTGFTIDFNRITTIKERVGYWRKANQIHGWFVDNVQNGNDNCGQYIVDVGQLIELKEIVDMVLQDHTEKFAEEHLPPTSGFFFGGDDIDEYYWEDLEYTQKLLGEIIKEHEGLSKNQQIYTTYTYQSSW